ncbi:MAG: hypothetical protein WBB52_15425, partial [Acidimicrobiales bacterium]
RRFHGVDHGVKILVYILIPALVVAVVAVISWVRNRQPTSMEAGLDSFRREMRALSPEAAPSFRHREEPGSDGRPGPPRPPRPPGTAS